MPQKIYLRFEYYDKGKKKELITIQAISFQVFDVHENYVLDRYPEDQQQPKNSRNLVFITSVVQ